MAGLPTESFVFKDRLLLLLFSRQMGRIANEGVAFQLVTGLVPIASVAEGHADKRSQVAR